MNWRLILLSVVIVIIAITLFFFEKIIGILLSILGILVPILPYLLKPRVSLAIEDIRFSEKGFDEVKGYQVKAKVTNKGKRIASDLTASVKVHDSNGQPVNLLRISVTTRDGYREVKSSVEPMRDAGYVWINKKGNRIKGPWKELRQGDTVDLLYPEEHTGFGATSIGGPTSFSHFETLLELKPDTFYQVIPEVKGEDPDKNTVTGSRKVTIGIRPSITKPRFSLVKIFSKTLKRYSAIIGLLLILFLGIKILNTSYLCLTHESSEIQEVPPENMYTDAWKQTMGYWQNNVGVSFRYLLIPGLGVPRMFWVAYDQTNSNFKNHYAHGAGEVWGYLATISFHGILESMGAFLMAIAGFLFWPVFLVSIGLAFIIKSAARRKLPFVKKVGVFAKFLFIDLCVLISLGILLIFIAGPIEAYLSWPHLLLVFTGHLWLPLMYLTFLFLLVGWLFFAKFGGWIQIKRFWNLICKHVHVHFKISRR